MRGHNRSTQPSGEVFNCHTVDESLSFPDRGARDDDKIRLPPTQGRRHVPPREQPGRRDGAAEEAVRNDRDMGLDISLPELRGQLLDEWRGHLTRDKCDAKRASESRWPQTADAIEKQTAATDPVAKLSEVLVLGAAREGRADQQVEFVRSEHEARPEGAQELSLPSTDRLYQLPRQCAADTLHSAAAPAMPSMPDGDDANGTKTWMQGGEIRDSAPEVVTVVEAGADDDLRVKLDPLAAEGPHLPEHIGNGAAEDAPADVRLRCVDRDIEW